MTTDTKTPPQEATPDQGQTPPPAPPDTPPTTDELLEFLSDEERAALQESDYVEDHEDQEAEKGGKDEPVGENEAKADSPAGADKETQADPAEAEKAQVETPATPKDAPVEADLPVQPVAGEIPVSEMSVPDVRKMDNRIREIDDELDSLTEQFENGELTDKDYREQQKALNAESRKLSGDVAVANNSVKEFNKLWEKAAQNYLEAYPGLMADDAVYDAFDAATRLVTSNPAFNKLTFTQQLQKAHAFIAMEAEADGLNVPPIRASPKPKTNPKPAQKGGAKPDPAPRHVPTLADLPSSEVSGANDSPLAQLQQIIDTGTADEIEAAMSRLTPEQRDQFSSMDFG